MVERRTKDSARQDDSNPRLINTSRKERPRSEEWRREREDRRADIHNRAVQGLLVINGGGAVALLTFLPQAWEKSREIVPAIGLSLLAMVIGLAFAGSINFLRYESSRAYDWAATKRIGQKYGLAWRWFAWGSLAMFIFGAIIVGCAIFFTA